MSDTTKLFELAQLAEASYANLVGGNAVLLAELQNTANKMTFSTTQASEFAKHWRVITHQPDTASSFSATLFQRIDDDSLGGFQKDQYVYAIRGTAGLSDLATDAGDIVVDGLALDQIVDMYNDWQRINAGTGQLYQAAILATDLEKTAIRAAMLPGATAAYDLVLASQGYIIDKPLGLVRKIEFDWSDAVFGASDPRARGDVDIVGTMLTEVTGHSLGGHLAAAFTRLFPDYAEAVTINGAGYPTGLVPGVGGMATSNIANLFVQLNGDVQFDASVIHNIYGEEMPEFVTMDQTLGLRQQGSNDALFIEQPDLVSNTGGHGSSQMTDSLAVYSLLSQLDPSATLATLKPYFEQASNSAERSLESLIDGLSSTLGIAVFTRTDNRNDLYTDIAALQTSTAFQSLIGKVQIVAPPISAKAAREDFGAFLSLINLTPFALKPNDNTAASILKNINSTNSDLALKWAEDNALTAAERANGEANYSDLWLADRAAMFSWIIKRNTEDISGDYGIGPDAAQDSMFYDAASGTTINLGSIAASNESRRHFLFGADNKNDTFTGGSKNDRLYGMAGTDTLTGGKGNDYLEGGVDFDTYVIKAGDGTDTILDTDGSGRIELEGLDLSTISAQYLSPNLWKSADNRITYFLQTQPDGSKTLRISGAGDGVVLVKNYRNGDLGINLPETPEDNPALITDRTIVGDRAPVDFGSEPGVQMQFDALGNIITDPDTPAPGRADTLHGSAGNDRIEGRDGNDTLNGGAGGDTIDGGTTQLFIHRGTTNIIVRDWQDGPWHRSGRRKRSPPAPSKATTRCSTRTPTTAESNPATTALTTSRPTTASKSSGKTSSTAVSATT